MQEVIVHSIMMGDVEDPDLFVAEPIWKWQQTDEGKWVMKKSVQQPMWRRHIDQASYALLTHMLAQVCDLKVGELIISTGDTHIYSDHVEQVNEQLRREAFKQPTLWLNPDIKDINKFTMDDIKLIDYRSHDTIKAKMAV